MQHLHPVTGADKWFSVDPSTHALLNKATGRSTLVQYDHNSERLLFELPRYIEGHDTALCNVVQVHYLNIDAQTKEEKRGLYEVDDLQVNPEDEQTVTCSWLVSHNGTQLVGPLHFLLRLACVVDGEPLYVWNTAIYTGLSVATGIYNGDYVAEEYADILEKWRQDMESLASRVDEAAKDAPIMITMSADCASIDGEITITDVSMPPTEIQKTFGSGKHFRAVLTISINGSAFNKYMGCVDLCQGFMVIGSNPKNLLQWTGAVNRVSSSGVSNESYRVVVDLNNVDSPIGGTIKAFRIANNADVEDAKTRLSIAETNIKGIDARVKKIEEEGAGGGACGCEYATDEEILAMMLEMDALPTLVDADGDVLIGADNTILLI